MCVFICWLTNTLLAIMTLHAGLVIQTVGAFVQVYFQSIYIFLFILGIVSPAVYRNFRFDFFFLPDIDECKSENHDCHANANCLNTLGSYNCSCWPGYKGNGAICTDIMKKLFHSS